MPRGPRKLPRLLVILAVAVGTLFWTAPVGAAPPPPKNDSLENATQIKQLPSTKRLNSTYDATAFSEPHPSCVFPGSMQKTVWYSFTPKSSLNIDVDTIGSDYDTVLAVYETSPGANTEQACDDGAAGLASAIYDLPLVGGTTYYFQVGGYGYASGKLRFNLQESA